MAQGESKAVAALHRLPIENFSAKGKLDGLAATEAEKERKIERCQCTVTRNAFRGKAC